ncbi:MAG: hypothetical protein ABSE73_08105 [Planctomycetota bacterium]
MATETAPAVGRAGLFAGAGSVLIALWLASGAVGVLDTDCTETAHAAGILLALCAGALFWRGAARSAARATGRLWLAGVFLAGALVLSPLFQQGASARGLTHSSLAMQLSVAISCMAALLLWITWLALGPSAGLRSSAPGPRSPEPGAALEAFILAPKARLHIAAAWMLLVVADAGLNGLPLPAALARAGFVALLTLCLPALLSLVAFSAGRRAVQVSLALMLLLSTTAGAARYVDLRGKVKALYTLLDENREAEALKVHQAALAQNEVLRARGTAVELEACWAAYRERTGNYASALEHWRRIAEQRGADLMELQPVRRIFCKMGDSLNSWRRLIYQGFPAVSDPEIAPGIKTLGDSPNGDLRARLLAALLSWEQNEPPEELKRRLERVRSACPDEVNACNLLKRLGTDVPDTALQLPGELIVGRTSSSESVLGAIEELGEVDTVVVLDKGHWEVALNAHGSPLHEEWPIVRLELNGQVIGRTQVNRAVDHEVPFTLEINRGNIYHVKIIFENRMEDAVQGHISRRGLTINGLSFRTGKKGIEN